MGKEFNPQFSHFGPKPPCGKKCPDRAAGCSVTCAKWQAYIKERNEHYERRRKEKKQ